MSTTVFVSKPFARRTTFEQVLQASAGSGHLLLPPQDDQAYTIPSCFLDGFPIPSAAEAERLERRKALYSQSPNAAYVIELFHPDHPRLYIDCKDFRIYHSVAAIDRAMEQYGWYWTETNRCPIKGAALGDIYILQPVFSIISSHLISSRDWIAYPCRWDEMRWDEIRLDRMSPYLISLRHSALPKHTLTFPDP